MRIDHIGSTSVPGLAAKDVIDIQVTVDSLGESVLTKMLAMGFQRWKDVLHDHVPPGTALLEGEEPLSAGSPEWEKWLFNESIGERRMNIHFRIDGRPNQRYPILFRDYLRAHPSTAQAYAELKRRLANHLADPRNYPDVKDPAVDLIYLAAEDWAVETGWVPGDSDA